ncbi:venom acid phosphatase Acph-1-like isoform X2 [Rhynchophorus ferrugineus]|uniref:venom acid phosphatase Acph-1-like isoform X2 n=1 Tax=Rhynchophorus ferrugineus TaxID=354439 RepID=UPI003FCD858C
MKFLIIFAFWLGGFQVLAVEQPSTLKLVHVLFRHGDRNPETSSLWETNPYYNESFYRQGYGQLTNNGKRTEYSLGQALRERYDDFLGSEWNINYIDVRSSDVNRTKMSALLVNAGLWPPEDDDVWLSSFNWQPVPYNYLPSEDDKEELGFPLEEWTQSVYPEPLHSAAVDYYYIETNNTILRKITSGYLLNKILFDTENKINGNISPQNRKMFFYSGHETNIATLLLTLEAYDLTDIPPYGGYVLLELHEIDGVNGLKLFYQNYEQADPIPLKLPNCDYFCVYDDFYQQVQDILPTADTDCIASNLDKLKRRRNIIV